jgi:hypothetical protein
MASNGILVIVEQEIPKNASQLNEEDMINFIHSQYSSVNRKEAQEAWDDTPEITRQILRQQNSNRLKQNYMQVLPVNRNLHTCRSSSGEKTTGLLDEIAGAFLNEWKKRHILSPNVGYGDVKKCVVAATKQLFGFQNVDNNSTLDSPQGHYKIMGLEGSRRLKYLTLAQLIHRGFIRIV